MQIAQIRQNAQAAAMSEMLTTSHEKCFNICITQFKDRIDQDQANCLLHCQKKFFEVRKVLAEFMKGNTCTN